ncbi:MAG TPA: small multidrug efflux protein [Microbacterium sp.]|nr:small multidrug efflux protein [Microbacterium sp.]
MNLIDTFQDLVARVPELVQPLIVALAGAVPFIEGEGSAAIGVIGGINPIVAAVAGAIGNFVCVAVLVLAGAGTRRVIVERRRAAVAAGDGSVAAPEPASPRKEKFQRALVRYGVPGVSLLGPLLLPTQFTATMLAAAGVGRGRILFWQGLAIVLWTTLVTLLITGVISVAQ